VIWSGLAPVLCGFVQFFGHGIYVNIKLKSFYNPGVATNVFGWITIGVVYIHLILINNMMDLWIWLFAVAWMTVFFFLNFILIEQIFLGNKNSPYPFDPDEMKRFNVEKKLELTKQ